MRSAVLVLALWGCTRQNSNALTNCTPGEQRQCACLGGGTGIQICDPSGHLLGECLGCSLFDLAGASLDLSFDPEGHDLAGLDFASTSHHTEEGSDDLASSDLPAVETGEDMLMSTGDLAAPVPCPNVMLVLDESGSMDYTLPDGVTTHMEAAKAALSKLVDHYGGRVPFGLTTFEGEAVCTSSIVVAVEPHAGSGPSIKSLLASAAAGGSTNTGNAYDVISLDPAMQQSGSRIVLLTDGAANCELDDPQFAADEAQKAQPSYVVALDLLDTDVEGVEAMAQAGRHPCTSGFCGGYSFYPASTTAQLDRALDLVLNDITQGCGGFGCFPSGAPCGAGTSCCGTAGCKDLLHDPENCGQCGTKCGQGMCLSGVCTKPDMAPPRDMTPGPDLGTCGCSQDCAYGCVAQDCCGEDYWYGLCDPTPNLCTCTGIFC